jgi:hypothetical protein
LLVHLQLGNYDPGAESVVVPVTMVFIRWIIGGIGPTEKPLGIDISQIDAAMAHTIAEIVVPISAVKGNSGLVNKESCPGNSR